MFDSGATIVLILLGLVMWGNYRNGTLPKWLAAKFLNRTGADATDFSGAGSGAGGGEFVSATTASLTGLGGGAGQLAAPIDPSYDPKVTGTFGELRPGHTHAGVDLAVPTGTPIDAARGGQVIYAGAAAGYGQLVTIDHGGGVTTRYGHLSKILVSVGQKLNVGQELGLAGATGDATGPHLHFEYRQNGVPLNPWPLIAPDYGTVVSA